MQGVRARRKWRREAELPTPPWHCATSWRAWHNTLAPMISQEQVSLSMNLILTVDMWNVSPLRENVLGKYLHGLSLTAFHVLSLA